MSIAVSTNIVPSRLFFGGMAVIVAMIAMIGVAVVYSFIGGHLSIFSRMVIFFVCELMACIGYFCILQNRKIMGLHITGSGQVRLVDYSCQAEARIGHRGVHGELGQLLVGSTVWANLLLLRIKLENGKVQTVLILPDAVSKEVFRSLKVACCWSASQCRDVITYTTS